MNYVRTFFAKPLRTDSTIGGIQGSVFALDFTGILGLVKMDDGGCVAFLSGGGIFKIQEPCVSDFLKAFEEYARDMQSLERGPVRLPPSMQTPKVGRTP